MPLKKLPLLPGVNRETTRYTNEGSWIECNNIRFRQSFPEKIGGWVRATTNTFAGVCRHLFRWSTLGGVEVRSFGTHLKYYVELGGAFFDVTPIRNTTSAGEVTFSATDGSSVLTVTDTAHGAVTNDYVTYSGASTLGGTITAAILNAEHQVVSRTDANTYTIDVTTAANASDTGNGGASVVGAYQLNTGPQIQIPITGWGACQWGQGPWGSCDDATESLRKWHTSNFGEDLVFGYSGGPLCYLDYSVGLETRAVLLPDVSGASDVPTIHNLALVSDASRFVFAFGCNDIGSGTLDPMLIRWSDQEDATNWTPSATNQAGDIRLSRGSKIVAILQARQEILVWTDVAMYSLQYVGGDIVWATQIIEDSLSCMISSLSPTYVAGITYWLAENSFYIYDGRVNSLVCDLRRYIFTNVNRKQYEQLFSGSNEQFHEVWWFYCSGTSTTIDSYVVYNYKENIWYYGSMARTAWIDNAWSCRPLAATYNNLLLVHEIGVDDVETGSNVGIAAFIESGQFDIDDGNNFSFIRRVLPDINFTGSEIDSPVVTMTLKALNSSGSGYHTTQSEGGVNNKTSTRTATSPVEVYTDQLYIRVRGRQMAFRIESDAAGVQWQLGSPRIDLRADGRRG